MRTGKIIGAILGLVTLGAMAATAARVGVPNLNEKQGVSLRDESRTHRSYFIGRSHRGGGLRGGK